LREKNKKKEKKMRKYLVIFVVLMGLYLVFAFASGEKMTNIRDLDLSVKPKDFRPESAVKPNIDFGKIPLYFITNKGQVNEKAKFYAKASRYTLWLTKEGLVFDSVKKVKAEDETTHPAPPGHPSQEGNNLGSPKIARDVSRLIFLDANKSPEMVPVEESKLRVNYFIGSDKSKWHGDIPTSMAVLYKNLYKNIDLKVYGLEKQIEYDWIVKSGGDPGDIRFRYKNVKGTRIDEEGNLLIETDFGELMHKKPVSYQTRTAQGAKRKAQNACPEERKYVNVTFKKIAENTYGFEAGAYDKSRELIIDPVVLAYSTYLGGVSGERSRGIAVDGSGNAYVTGVTTSPDFPTRNQYQGYQGGCDVFVTKLDTTKSGVSSLIYSTYLGGGSHEYGWGIAVDAGGNVYVAGETSSPDFPTRNQYQGYQGFIDVFVTRLDTTKNGVSSIIYSTYLGGGRYEYGWGIAVDAGGSAYVTGRTSSPDFPTHNQYQEHHGNDDVFVTRLDTNQSGASSLLYSTYLGGGKYDWGKGIAVDDSGNAYVTGETGSSDFPTRNQYQGNNGHSDAFVTKLDTTGSGASSLLYSTYLGGGNYDKGSAIAVDAGGNVYVTGGTGSSDFPTRNQYQGYQGGWYDVFVTKLDPAQSGTSSLLYSTYLGGGRQDQGTGIAVDSASNAFVTGATISSNFPILDQYQVHQRIWDVFVTRLDPTKSGASGLLYSTYLGGWNNEYAHAIAVDGSGNAYVTGVTSSTNFPTLNQYQGYQGNHDAFVTKLSFVGPGNEPPTAICQDIEVAADENCEVYITAADVDGGSYDPDEGDEITLSLDNTGPFSPGAHYVQLTVADQKGESDSCFAEVTVKDQSSPVISLDDPLCIQLDNGKGNMANKLSLTVQDNCSDIVDLQILNVEVYNNGGNLVNGQGIFEVMDNDIYVYPDGNGWSVIITVEAVDAYGNTASETFSKDLLKCN
jgi:hypothetical protein